MGQTVADPLVPPVPITIPKNTFVIPLPDQVVTVAITHTYFPDSEVRAFPLRRGGEKTRVLQAETRVLLITSTGNHVGTAFCSINDLFLPVKGVAVALERALTNAEATPEAAYTIKSAVLPVIAQRSKRVRPSPLKQARREIEYLRDTLFGIGKVLGQLSTDLK